MLLGSKLIEHWQTHAVTNRQLKGHVGILAVLFAINPIVNTGQSRSAIFLGVHQSSKARLRESSLVFFPDHQRGLATTTNPRGILLKEFTHLKAKRLCLLWG